MEALIGAVYIDSGGDLLKVLDTFKFMFCPFILFVAKFSKQLNHEPKEDFIIFWRQEPSGYGASDLYISFKQKGKWSKPLNLGPNINSKQGDFCPFMQPRGKKLYFSRTEVREGKRIEDLYSVDFSVKEWKIKLVNKHSSEAKK